MAPLPMHATSSCVGRALLIPRSTKASAAAEYSTLVARALLLSAQPPHPPLRTGPSPSLINAASSSTTNRPIIILSTAGYHTLVSPGRLVYLKNGTVHHSLSSPSQQQQQRSFSSKKRDFYELLGVSRDADKATIKKAYFKLAKQYHPDTNKGDSNASEKFKEVTEAYEVLSDDKQREMYNQFGHAGVDPNFQEGNPFEGFQSGGGGFQGFNFGDGSFHFSSSAQEIDPEDLFDAFFGGGNRRRRKPRGPRRGSDLQMHIRLSFKEAVFGASKDLHLRYQVSDEKGNVSVKERDVTVETPAGIENGMNLRLAGQGAEGDPGAPRGNLLVQVVVDDDEYFVRDGADVHTEVPISFTQAILGGTVEVKTLTGNVEMKVPKGSQVDTKLMLRGKGIQRLHGGGKGNHIVHLKIEIPKEVTPRQEQLLREYDDEAKHHGTGISGRLAKAAGSAFETFFGGKNKKGDNSTNNSGSTSTDNKSSDETKDKTDDSQTDDESYNKKAAV